MAEIPPFKIDLKMPDVDDILRPLRLSTIGLEGVEEVTRARKKHGSNADLAYGVGAGSNSIARMLLGVESDHVENRTIESRIKTFNDYGMAHGRTHTRLGVLLEEVIEAGASDNNADLRTELIQVIAMAQDWVADIDAEGAADQVDGSDA